MVMAVTAVKGSWLQAYGSRMTKTSNLESAVFPEEDAALQGSGLFLARTHCCSVGGGGCCEHVLPQQREGEGMEVRGQFPCTRGRCLPCPCLAVTLAVQFP